jgi:predicted CoA-substrate-specific enzyme activase
MMLLGVDAGSAAASLALLEPPSRLVAWRYAFHQGRIRETLAGLLEEMRLDEPVLTACTTPGLLEGALLCDGQLCQIAAARHFHGRPAGLLVVGAERFTLFHFQEDGSFRSLRTNSSCAAGTGSFLDQQARRLGLAGSAELAERAQASRGSPPLIASRCSVFAKTDLSHAQASGYSLEAICDGLCLGLARNIADTVGTGLRPPVVFAGGVARNPAVRRHLERLLGCELACDEHPHLYGAIGACLLSLGREREAEARRPAVAPAACGKRYFHAPLRLSLSSYPDFGDARAAEFVPREVQGGPAVEVELFRRDGWDGACVLGLDVGSTSTKAALVAPDHRLLAGFYTRTAGRPLVAVRAILEALAENLAEPKLAAVGTTGAGRRFVGQVIGADAMLNEITAHAHAAVQLQPATDTIIEIGGQDSKFTALRDGRVTFARMNTVCAAGTGSFLEEQAARLGVSLSDYARLAEGRPAPLASDRCTVFMERDLNHLLAEKFEVEEILAAALHSVCENYLLKVASAALIGQAVCFQGATARNRALVAVFERRLGRPIYVSRYCHLTGALGVALSLLESPPEASRFRGIGLYREEIPVSGEICGLCANHCRLSLARVQGSTVAFGFQCGRDYQTQRFVRRSVPGLDLKEARADALRAFTAPGRAQAAHCAPQMARCAAPVIGLHPTPCVGLPAALHLAEELPLWESFFAELGLPTVAGKTEAQALAAGKEAAGAEFCAPVAALHGQVRRLSCDAVFLPVYLEAGGGRGTGRLPRACCYYTQFAPTVVSLSPAAGPQRPCLLPLVDPARPRRTARELHQVLAPLASRAGGRALTVRRVAAAYRRALARQDLRRRALRAQRRSCAPPAGGMPAQAGEVQVEVVLLGRPYVVLDPAMNKGIPELFASLGVRALYQDMLPAAATDSRRVRKLLRELRPLRKAFPWYHAQRILEAAAAAARTPGLYPVLLTSFKCSPDSFLVEYFQRLLEAHRKPYLVLQIDEHASNVGYETRIEAGLHSFRNHAAAEAGCRAAGAAAAGAPAASAAAGAILPPVERRLKGRTLLLPNWDPLSLPLVASALQRAGVDARVLEEEELAIQRGMRWNTGQCLPLNAIAEEAAQYVQRHSLDPARTVLWMPRSTWACNIPMFPHYLRTLLERYGPAARGLSVYVGSLFHGDLARGVALEVALAYCFGGLLRTLSCRLRPYEREPGRTDQLLAESHGLFQAVFRGELPRERTLAEVLERFEAVPLDGSERRPQVAIFGDLYVRTNDVFNQGLTRAVEQAGGEVVATPYSDYLRIVAESFFRNALRNGRLVEWLRMRLLMAVGEAVERRFGPAYARWVCPPASFHNPDLESDLASFHVKLEASGESYDNVLKILHLKRQFPDIALFVQASPAFCCPSLVTEAMGAHIERVTGVPVVSLSYDGTGTPQNDRILPYLRYPRRGEGHHGAGCPRCGARG